MLRATLRSRRFVLCLSLCLFAPAIDAQDAEPSGAASAVEADESPKRAGETSERTGSPKSRDRQTADQKKPKWTPLFDGKTLKGWKVTKFGGEGEVLVKDGALVLSFGNDLTGVHTKRKLPKVNYEVKLQAQRVDGSDFFCGFTFPVKDSFCSLIVGGWGGGVCGLSSLDYMDASENETTTYREFKQGEWYDIKVRVTDAKIEAWIGDEQIVDVETKGRRISTRLEVDLSQPFGFASWQTTAALRKIQIRPLDGDADQTPQSSQTSE